MDLIRVAEVGYQSQTAMLGAGNFLRCCYPTRKKSTCCLAGVHRFMSNSGEFGEGLAGFVDNNVATVSRSVKGIRSA